jgi:hypothetical protein
MIRQTTVDCRTAERYRTALQRMMGPRTAALQCMLERRRRVLHCKMSREHCRALRNRRPAAVRRKLYKKVDQKQIPRPRESRRLNQLKTIRALSVQ